MKKLQWSGLSLSYQPYFLLLPHKLFFACLFVSLIAWFCFSFLGQSFNMLWAFPTSCLGLSHSFYLECSLHQISSSVSKGFLCRSLKMETQADHSNKVIYFTLWEPLKFLVLFIMLIICSLSNKIFITFFNQLLSVNYRLFSVVFLFLFSLISALYFFPSA